MIDRRRLQGSYAFMALGLLILVGFMVSEFIQASQNGRGSGFGDTRLVPSCYAPGGPYFPQDMPRSERQCPNPVTRP